ncbi:MotA/TolQ/ExbB proton channel family protein [Verrucomicrobiota bacterium]
MYRSVKFALMVLIAFSIFLIVPVSMGAQVEEVIGGSGASWSWKQILQSGGWVMYVLIAISVLMLALVIYFIMVLRFDQIAPAFLRRELLDKIKAGAIDEARRVCEFRRCPLSEVAISALNYLRDVEEPDPVMLKDVVEGEGSRQAESFLGQTQYLLDIAVVSPMIGLLGTVFGMLRAFSAVALDIAKARPIVLAEGVSQALITTAFGLMVGIPAMMFYAYFRRSASKLVSHLETASTEILTVLLSSTRTPPR